MGSVFDLDRLPDQRERCNACMMACYRNASMLMHSPIAFADAARALLSGRVRTAVAALMQPGVAASLGALSEEMPHIRRLAPRRRRDADISSSSPALL